MNIDDEAKLDRMVAQADIFIPGFSPELLTAVGASRVDEECADGMEPQKESNGGVLIRGNSFQWPVTDNLVRGSKSLGILVRP